MDLIVAKVQQHTLDMYKYVQALQVVSADFTYRYDAQLQNMELRGCLRSMPEIRTDMS